MYDLYIKQPIRILYTVHYRSVLLRKESFTGDGHQFHQYQQNKQSPPILTELMVKHKKTMTYNLLFQVLAWDRHIKGGGC